MLKFFLLYIKQKLKTLNRNSYVKLNILNKQRTK